MTSNFKQIAIIGQACRFPGGADSPKAFWDLLMAGTDAVTEVPDDRFDKRRFFHPDPGVRGRSYTFAAATIGDVSGFDAGFFGISAREAREMDPQQRLLLELAEEAFESAGLVPQRLAGSNCAVYVGISGSDYAERRMGDLETVDPYFMLGATLSIAANRISYAFDLRGPSLAVDTACSSALVALNEAVQALAQGRASMAVVAAANLLLSPAAFVGFSKAMMLAKDGRCRAFGEGGEGYVRGEGGGALILKPLKDAERDGDPILAVIRGVGTNTDGRTHGIALPSSASQEALLRQVYRQARVSPASVSYFEAHGTGTAVGDPAEAGAIGRAIGRKRPRNQPLLIGSAKSNIGHLEPAAGMAGLIKAIGVLRHGLVPPSLHAQRRNPDIAFHDLNIDVVSTAVPLPRRDGRAIVGVNSFGFGGTNAHVILESYLSADRPMADAPQSLPLLLSARSETALKAQAERMRARLVTARPQEWRDIAYTAACRRAHHEHRLILRAHNAEEARARLCEIVSGAKLSPHAGTSRNAKTALVFVGNGAQWVGMGARLLDEDPVFREVVAHIDSVARWRLGWSVIQMMQSPQVALDDTAVAQPLLFALQLALVESLKARGLSFDGTVGHSVGEVAAAHVAGALSLEQAVSVIVRRSEAQGRTRGHGHMLAAVLDEAAARDVIAPYDDLIEVAAINSPRGVTLSGDVAAIAHLAVELERRGIAAKVLDLDYAFHSRSQDPTRETLLQALAQLKPQAAIRDFYSTVTGTKREGATLTADHWWHNIRDKVRFADAITAMEQDGYHMFLEIGPDALLQGNLRQILKSGRAMAMLTRTRDGASDVEQALDQAWTFGASVDFGHHFPGGGRVMDLPAYPWQRERAWHEPTAEAAGNFSTRHEAPLLGMRVAPGLDAWQMLFDPAAIPFLADHQVQGSVLVPAAAFVEMVLEAGQLLHGDAPLEIEGLKISRPLVLDRPRMVRFTMGEGGFFRIESREHMQGGGWTAHAAGRLAPLSRMPDLTAVPQPGAEAQIVSRGAHYDFTASCGFGYGPVFQILEEIKVDDASAGASLTPQGNHPYRLHPALLDGLLQAIFPILRRRVGEGGETFVPQRIGRMFFAGGDATQAQIALNGGGPRSIFAHGFLQDGEGRIVAEVQDIRLARLPLRSAAPGVSLYDMTMWPLPPLIPTPVADAAVKAALSAQGTVPGDEGNMLLDRLASAFAADALLVHGDAPAGDVDLAARLVAMVERHPDALDDPRAMWRAAIAARPDLSMELTALGRAGLALVARLRGEAALPVDAAALLAAPIFGVAHKAVRDTVQAFVEAWPHDRRLRVFTAGSFPGLESLLPAELCDVVADAPDGLFDLVVALGDPPYAPVLSPGALSLQIVPTSSPWTELAFDGTTAQGQSIITAIAPNEVSVPMTQRRDWLLLTDAASLEEAEKLAMILSSQDQRALVQDAAQALPVGAPLHLVWLAGLDGAGLEAQARRCDGVLALLREVPVGELILVTRGAITGRDPPQAALLGLGRVLQNERPDISCRLVDLDGAPPEALAREIMWGTESEVLLTAGGRLQSRLKTAAAPQTDAPSHVLGATGSLDSLTWSPAPRRELTGDEVEVAVEAAGLNFRDVMFAMGLLPDDILEGGFAGASLGMEGAGLVTRVGLDVMDIAPGDAVVCFAPASLASHLVTRRFAVAKVPDGMAMPAAATLITAFFTVTYALSHLARLKRGERILIHSAAGGVGIAAIQYARHVGAEIFATAGSMEKRDIVRLLGVEEDHILDSRNNDFAARIRARTNGEGVDVVLNSLAGEAVHRGLSLLRPFGRFLELGKVDFVANSRLGLGVFRNNIAYHGVDADQLMAAHAGLAAEIFQQTMALFAQGAYAPLPYRVFERNDVVEAFRYMQRARHIGKIVIRTRAEEPPVAQPERITLDPNAAYLVTGGLSGFGLASAQWLAARGARHLVLVSRSGKPSDGAAIAVLEAGGVRVDLRACDVTDETAVSALVRDYASSLKGVIHAAAAYDDGAVADLTPERLRKVLDPKAGGALVLDKAMAGLKLDIFLLYSSISAAIGNPGQANYVAANLVLESLAARRRAQRLAVQLVALAPVADTGQMRERVGLGDAFAKIGVRPINQDEIFAEMDRIVLGGAPGMLIADVKWQKLARSLPALKSGRFRALVAVGAAEADAAGMDFAALAAQLPHGEFQALLLAQLAQAVGQILRVPAEQLNRDCSVFELGMDSLMGLELHLSVEEKFGIELPPMALAQDASLRRLAEMIAHRLTGISTGVKSRDDSAASSLEEQQAHMISRHDAHIDADQIAETMAEMREAGQPRLVP